MDMEILDALDATFDHAQKIVAGVKPDQLDDPTGCAKWDVRDLVGHMNGTLQAFGSLLEGGEPVAGAPSDDPLTNYPKEIAKARGMWHQPDAFEGTVKMGPMGDVPKETAARFAIQEMLAHAWDLAKATGQDTDLPEDVVADAIPIARDFLPDQARNENGDPFGLAIDLPADASPTDQYVALLGRRP
jgi:uncharacterized protein (TIGR03086 family)